VDEEFTAYVAARGRALWGAAWLLTGDPALAEDLVQTALTKTWPHFERVAADGSFEGYVRRTLVTTYLSWRGRRWHGELPSGSGDDVATGLAALNPDADTTHDVRRAMAQLSPRQRAVVVLRYFGDLSEEQTARAMGCSVGSVKTHHARALERLRGSGLLDLSEPTEEHR